MARWEDFISSIYTKILPLAVTIIAIVMGATEVSRRILQEIELEGLAEAFKFMMYPIFLILVVLVIFAIYQIALSKDIKDILDERLPVSRNNPDKEHRIETSGAGALGGKVIGGTLGLLGGPVGGYHRWHNRGYSGKSGRI